MSPDFITYLADRLPMVEGYLEANLPTADRSAAEASDLSSYLFDPLARFVRGGGKRIRPVLCLLGAEACGSDPKAALPIAYSLELFQAVALIHDDIADKSEMRRGAPCLHISEGTGLAINAGDTALVSLTAHIVRQKDMDPSLRLRLLDEIAEMEMRTLEGQALDLGWARDGRWDITAKDYLTMARLKTAYYSASCPLALGALCAGASEELVSGLKAFGLDAGLAFQIQDDLLNLVGDADAQGKDFRSDITEGKRTLVMVWALEHLEGEERDELAGILASAATEEARLARAVELAEAAGAIDHARDYAQELANHAKEGLGRLHIETCAREVLRSMADFFIERAK